MRGGRRDACRQLRDARPIVVIHQLGQQLALVDPFEVLHRHLADVSGHARQIQSGAARNTAKGSLLAINGLSAWQTDREYRGWTWGITDVRVERFFGPAEKINITVPGRLLKQIDDFAGPSTSSLKRTLLGPTCSF